MMRVWFFLAALSASLPAAAENFLMKSNGAGLAAVGMAAGAAASAALAGPPQWQGYPRGGDDGVWTPKADDSVNEWLRSGHGADCVTAGAAGLAKALKNDKPADSPPGQGQIRLTESQMPRASGKIEFDPAALGTEGLAVTCAPR